MDVGIHVPIFDIDGGTTAIAGELARVGAAVEASGANWLSFMDHFFQIEPTGLPAESNMLEGTRRWDSSPLIPRPSASACWSPA
jgi:hypothetical protein